MFLWKCVDIYTHHACFMLILNIRVSLLLYLSYSSLQIMVAVLKLANDVLFYVNEYGFKVMVLITRVFTYILLGLLK